MCSLIFHALITVLTPKSCPFIHSSVHFLYPRLLKVPHVSASLSRQAAATAKVKAGDAVTLNVSRLQQVMWQKRLSLTAVRLCVAVACVRTTGLPLPVPRCVRDLLQTSGGQLRRPHVQRVSGCHVSGGLRRPPVAPHRPQASGSPTVRRAVKCLHVTWLVASGLLQESCDATGTRTMVTLNQ